MAEFKATGRQEAFEEIVRRYAAMVFGVCLKTTRNAHDAEDATQAVFLTLAVQCKNPTGRGEILYVGPWLQKVARRISLDIRRSKKRRQVREETHANNNGHANGNGNGAYHDDRSAGVDVEELKVILNEELNQLPAKYRLPMILHYYGGLSRDEIARELGCKASTLGVRIHRGKQMLAKRLTERGASPIEMGMSLGAGLTLAVKSAVTDGMVISTSKAAAKLMAGEELGAMISSHVLSVAHGAVGAAMLAKLKLVAACVVVALVTAAAGATAKVVPLDQFKLQLPVRFDGLFELPRLRSPFRAPQVNAGQAQESVLAAATRSAATDAAVEAVIWLAEGDAFGDRPRARPNGSTTRARRPVPGLGVTERVLARVVSSVVGATVSGSTNAANGLSPAVAAVAPAPASAATAVALAPATGVVPAPASVSAAGGPVPGAKSGVDFSGSVQFSDGATIYAMNPPTRASVPAAGGTAQPAAAPPLPPRTTVAAAGPAVTVGGPVGSFGRVVQNGGRFEAATQIIGDRGHGQYVQRGGENVVTDMRLGVEPGSVGEYWLEGGVLVFKPAPMGRGIDGAADTLAGGTPRNTGLHVGDRGTGVFNIGSTYSAGEINTRWDSPASSLVVRGDSEGTGVFRGWGRVSMGGFFDHSGQAIADGHGLGHALEFQGFRYVGNSIENPANGGKSGWFARNGGTLVLPRFVVKAGDSGTYTWGEDPNDPVIDLVNSARITMHDVKAAGALNVALLSKDNFEVPTLPQGHTFIGVWKFDAGTMEHGAVDLVVRYDDGLAHELGLKENALKLWRYTDGKWLRINDGTFYRDVDLNLIGGTAPAGGLDFFAVSAPEPSALGLALFGAAAALLRRPRRR